MVCLFFRAALISDRRSRKRFALKFWNEQEIVPDKLAALFGGLKRDDKGGDWK